ncbi:hypothetical protein AALC75_05465 [Lachnospiraceae bacterium 48-42]
MLKYKCNYSDFVKDYAAVFNEMKNISHKRLRDVLEYQLNRYRTFFI